MAGLEIRCLRDGDLNRRSDPRYLELRAENVADGTGRFGAADFRSTM
jgi:hypothetical protein